MKTLNESCLEYFRRRLSEGWKCLSLEGHNAVLLSPEGIRRELDLRNDIETLRPNAAGDETSIPSQYPDSGYHWQKVDDEVAIDNDYVFDGSGSEVYRRDLYGLPDSAITGTINKVTVHFRVKSSTYGYAKPALKSNSTVTDGTEVDLTPEWANFSQEWATNPADAAAWELADINSLQAGVSLKDLALPCFTRDTRIAMADGSYKEVKDLHPGDKVAYYDFIERKIKFTTVTKINEHSADEMGPYYLVLNKKLKVTPEHPLDKPDGTVITAGEVQVGDFLQGETESLEISSVEKVWERVKTYSLETESKHYFIDGFSDMAKPLSTYCSQLYVEVDYTFVPPTPPTAPEYQRRVLMQKQPDGSYKEVSADYPFEVHDPKALFSMDFWSDFKEEVQLDGDVAATIALGTVTVHDLPDGATIVIAKAMFKFEMKENVHATIANKLDGATVANTSQVIQVADDTPGTYYDAINFVDDQFGIAAETREGGDVIIGSINIAGAGKVDANDGYLFRWLLALADEDYLKFNTCQVGLRIWYEG